MTPDLAIDTRREARSWRLRREAMRLKAVPYNEAWGRGFAAGVIFGMFLVMLVATYWGVCTFP
jgi:hypothetical protein